MCTCVLRSCLKCCVPVLEGQLPKLHVSAKEGKALAKASPSFQLSRLRRWRSKTGLIMSSSESGLRSRVSVSSYGHESVSVVVYGMKKLSKWYSVALYSWMILSRMAGKGK